MNYLSKLLAYSRHRAQTISGQSTNDGHGGGSVSSGSGNSPSTSIYKQINDSVDELHMPSTTEANMDILFFHGLQLEEKSITHIDTWSSRCADKSIWPKEWLPEEFPNACVLSISYDGSMKKNDKRGRMDLYLVAESLLRALMLAEIGQVRPVIVVSHSYGGLVIKQLCLLAHNTTSVQTQELSVETQPMQAFLHNIGGIFYYGTPHGGSRLTDIVEKLDSNEGELVNHVRVFSKNLARLNGGILNMKYNIWNISFLLKDKSISCY